MKTGAIPNLIYLDNNATTPLDERVLERMMPYLTFEFANANSTHLFGVKAYDAVKVARKQVADLIGAEPFEIVFTSGATEAINLGIKGIVENYSTKGKHIITAKTEHPAVLDTCRYLVEKGYEVTYLPVNLNGLVELEDLKNALRTDTCLVSIMMVNNETGVVQPIKEIAKLTHSVDAILMTDTTQAVGKIPISVDEMGIDILCLSGHKLYGPKGVGALYYRQRDTKIKLLPLLHGGGHEKGLRSGTLNVPGIVGLGAACALAHKEMAKSAETIGGLRNFLETELLKIEGTCVNGSIEQRLYNTSNILFKGVDSDALILGLCNPVDETPLIAVSNGSACTSASIEPSHVLTAMGLNEQDAFSSIRFSIGINNTKHEMKIVIEEVCKNVLQLRLL